MSFDEFVTNMEQAVKEKKKTEVSVSVHTAIKNNGKVLKGLLFTTQGVNMSPTIYLEEYYEQYLEGVSIKELVCHICTVYEKIKVDQSVPWEDMLLFENVKDKIVYKLIRKESNEELLKTVPFETFHDLAKVYYILLKQTSHGTVTISIRNEHLKLWGITKEQLSEIACENTPHLLPSKVFSLSPVMDVVTNEYSCYGASVMLYPNIWKEMREKWGENFYILPSSLEEVIVIPESYGMDGRQLARMVKEINEMVVAEENILSDNVYYYCDKEEKIVSGLNCQ